MNEVYRGLYTSSSILTRYIADDNAETQKVHFKMPHCVLISQNLARTIIYLGILAKICPELRNEVEQFKIKALKLNSGLTNSIVRSLDQFEFNNFDQLNTF